MEGFRKGFSDRPSPRLATTAKRADSDVDKLRITVLDVARIAPRVDTLADDFGVRPEYWLNVFLLTISRALRCVWPLIVDMLQTKAGHSASENIMARLRRS